MVLSMTPRAISPFVIAHEMGHVLGLDDVQDCDNGVYDGHCCNSDHEELMCTNGGYQSGYIPADKIGQARVAAERFSTYYYGDVRTFQATYPPAPVTTPGWLNDQAPIVDPNHFTKPPPVIPGAHPKQLPLLNFNAR